MKQTKLQTFETFEPKRVSARDNDDNQYNKARKQVKQFEGELRALAEKFWADRGAKYGQVQQVKDIVITSDDYLPRKFTPETKFKTLGVSYTLDHYGLQCDLWVEPFKKDGSLALPIRLSYIKIYKDDLRFF